MGRARRALLAVGVVLAAMMLHTAEAADGVPAPAQPQQGAMGIDSMFPPPSIQGANQPLLFEKYGVLNYTPLEIDHASQLQRGPIVGAMNEYLTLVASVETTVLLAIGTVTTHLVEWAFSLDLVTALSGPVASVVQSLKANLFDRYLWVAMFLVGVWVGWQFLVRRGVMRGFSGLAYAAAVVGIATIFFADPAGYMGSADAFGNELGTAVIGGVASYDPANGHDATTNSGSPRDAEVRLASNRLWVTWVYVPWTVAEFGTVDPAVPGTDHKLGQELLKKKHGDANSYDSDFQKMSQPVKDWANGDNSAERAGYGFLAIVISGVNAVLVIAVAVALLLASLVLLLATLASPLMFLFGVFPGAGHAMILRWFEIVLGALLTKVVLGTFLSIVMVLDGALAGLTSQIGWFLTALLQTALLLAAWHLRKTILHAGRAMASPRVTNVNHQHVQRTSSASTTANQYLGHARTRLTPSKQRSLPAPAGRAPARPGAPVSADPEPSTGREVGMAAKPRRLAGGAAARQGAGGAAARTGAAGAAGTAGATAATGGLAIAGLAAVKVGQGVIRFHDTARRGLQEHASAAMEGRPARPVSSSLPARSSSPPLRDSVTLSVGKSVGRRVLSRQTPPLTSGSRPKPPHRSEQRQVARPPQSRPMSPEQQQDVYDFVRETFDDSGDGK